MPENQDIHFLHHALSIAARGLGRTMPNPTVGCVLVKNNQVLAVARTADSGRPHAEAQALAIAGEKARGATAYVTLEPCSHHGKTPPCAQGLIDAGVARVVIACVDPDPRVSGRGIAMLEAAGIAVEQILLPEAAQLNRGFFRRIQPGLPHVAMKLATSEDHYLAHGDGKRQPITGELARQHGNGLRGAYDCVLTGIGTVLMDDPAMDVRAPYPPHPGLIRVVADRQLRLPLKSQLVRRAETHPVWVITGAEAIEQNASHATELRERGVTFLVLEEVVLPPARMLQALAAEGITRLLIEAGSQLSSAFLAENQVETLHWYRAPILLGNAGKSPISVLDSSLTPRRRPVCVETRPLGADRYECYELQE